MKEIERILNLDNNNEHKYTELLRLDRKVLDLGITHTKQQLTEAKSTSKKIYKAIKGLGGVYEEYGNVFLKTID